MASTWDTMKKIYTPVLTGTSMFGQSGFQATTPTLDQTQMNQYLAQSDATRGQQQYLAGKLQSQIEGQGPTVAGIQAQQGVAQAMRNAGTMAASARGTSRGLAQRSAMYAGAEASQQANRDAALLRAQEQLAATSQYGQASASQRAGDIQSAQLGMQAAQSNQEANLAAQRIQADIENENATRSQKGTGAIMSSIGGFIKGAGSDEKMKTDVKLLDANQIRSFSDSVDAGYGARQAGVERQNYYDSPSDYGLNPSAPNNLRSIEGESSNEFRLGGKPVNSAESSDAGMDTSGSGRSSGGVHGAVGGAIEAQGNALIDDRKNAISGWGDPGYEDDGLGSMSGGGGGGASMAGMVSDITTKEDLNGVKPYTFRYKPSVAARMADERASQVWQQTYQDATNPRTGVMAQDLERAGGNSDGVVMNEPGVGKLLNRDRALAFSLAANADLNRRLNRLEKRA